LARRDIKAGEEVTYDYGTTECNPKWTMDCLCGLECCRGRITGDDWKNPEFRAKFKGHFFGGVQGKIAQLEKEEAEKAAKEVAEAAPEATKGKRKSSCDSDCKTSTKKAEKKHKTQKKKSPSPKQHVTRHKQQAVVAH
jgi:hypothetical protein